MKLANLNLTQLRALLKQSLFFAEKNKGISKYDTQCDELWNELKRRGREDIYNRAYEKVEA